jgi:predicted HAD superfamily Cof-like phosphohydrolase
MLIAEEFLELCAALGYHPKLTLDRQVTPFPREHVYLPEVADALADLDYVIEGTRLEFGIDGGPIADAVHAANMRKVGGPTRADGKILKPDEWEPPDIAGELKKQGWDG